MTEYILKPVDPEELDKAVRDIKYKTELKEKNRNNQENSVVTSEELEEKIRLETYKETEIEWILQNILLLPDIRHPQSQKIRMILEYIFIHPNAKDAVGDFIGKSNFLPVDCAAQSLYEVMCFYVKRESHPSSVVNALLITIEQYRNAEVCLDYVAGQLFINSNYLSGLILSLIHISEPTRP